MWPAIGSMVLYGIWAFALERLSKLMSPMMMLAFSSAMWFCTEPIQFLIYWRLAKARGEVFTVSVATVGWQALILLTVSLGTLMMIIALKRESTAIATAVPSAYPIVALLLGVVFAHKSFRLTEWIGSLLVVAFKFRFVQSKPVIICDRLLKRLVAPTSKVP